MIEQESWNDILFCTRRCIVHVFLSLELEAAIRVEMRDVQEGYTVSSITMALLVISRMIGEIK